MDPANTVLFGAQIAIDDGFSMGGTIVSPVSYSQPYLIDKLGVIWE